MTRKHRSYSVWSVKVVNATQVIIYGNRRSVDGG